jgi:hypothetical protein
MPWGSQQWLRCTKESTYGTFNAGASGSDITWFRLVGANAFTARSVPQRQVIRSADGGNRRRQVVASRKVVAGALSTLWYPTQSAYVLGAALTLTSNDLASYTVDYFDSVQVHRFLGGKVQSLTVSSAAQQDYVPLNLGWVFQSRTTTTLAQPADTVFPSDLPYTHFESKGLLSVGGVVAKYSALEVKVSNQLAPTWDEDQWISACYYCGRDVDVKIRLQYLAATMRSNFESQAALTVSAAWQRAAGLLSTIDVKTKNYIADVSDELPLDNAGYQTVDIQAFYDQAASTDVAFTVA